MIIYALTASNPWSSGFCATSDSNRRNISSTMSAFSLAERESDRPEKLKKNKVVYI